MTDNQLYRAILADPADDTVRLALADFLDELPPVWVKCVRCMGTGSHGVNPYELAQRYGTHRAGVMLDALRCGVCNGTGEVLDTSNQDRAALIRLQLSPGYVYVPGRWEGQRFIERSKELIDAHPKWKQSKCRACGGTGYVGEDHCPTCRWTGDLLRTTPIHPSPVGGPVGVYSTRNPQFRRGFIDSVECTLAELGHEECPGFAPSPWALAIVRSLPVSRLRITDMPFDLPARNEWRLRRNGGSMPQALEDLIIGHDSSSPEAAIDALAAAACSIVRSHVYKEVKV